MAATTVLRARLWIPQEGNLFGEKEPAVRGDVSANTETVWPAAHYRQQVKDQYHYYLEEGAPEYRELEQCLGVPALLMQRYDIEELASALCVYSRTPIPLETDIIRLRRHLQLQPSHLHQQRMGAGEQPYLHVYDAKDVRLTKRSSRQSMVSFETVRFLWRQGYGELYLDITRLDERTFHVVMVTSDRGMIPASLKKGGSLKPGCSKLLAALARNRPSLLDDDLFSLCSGGRVTAEALHHTFPHLGLQGGGQLKHLTDKKSLAFMQKLALLIGDQRISRNLISLSAWHAKPQRTPSPELHAQPIPLKKAPAKFKKALEERAEAVEENSLPP